MCVLTTNALLLHIEQNLHGEKIESEMGSAWRLGKR